MARRRTTLPPSSDRSTDTTQRQTKALDGGVVGGTPLIWRLGERERETAVSEDLSGSTPKGVFHAVERRPGRPYPLRGPRPTNPNPTRSKPCLINPTNGIP